VRGLFFHFTPTLILKPQKIRIKIKNKKEKKDGKKMSEDEGVSE
jgi:hypothetical protein